MEKEIVRKMIAEPNQSDAVRKVAEYIKNDPCRLVDSIFRVRNNKGRLADYKMVEPHKILMRTGILGDRSAMYSVINKGRQEGFSVYSAVEDLLIGKMMPNTWQYYGATREKSAKAWIKKVEQLAKDARCWFDGSRIIDIDAHKSSQLEKLIKHFPNGLKKEVQYSYIVGIAASPGGVRGETAVNVTLDEFAWMIKTKNMQREMLESVKHFINQGGQLRLQSTPVVRSDEFWKIYSQPEEKMFKAFYFPTITNWETLDLGKDLRKQHCIIPYPWISIDSLEQARCDDLEYFKQEVLGIPIDVLFRFLTPELLEECTDSEEKVRRAPKECYIIAIDVAAVRDLTAIVVAEVIGEELWERGLFELRGDYKIQADEIKKIIDMFDPMYVAIDTTGGHGRGVADTLEHIASSVIKRVEFASTIEIDSGPDEKKIKMTEFLANTFKNSLINHKYHMIENRQAFNHCMNVERIITSSGQVRYSGKKNGRDDYFWARAMAASNFGLYTSGDAFGSKSESMSTTTGRSLLRKQKDYGMPLHNGGGFLTF